MLWPATFVAIALAGITLAMALRSRRSAPFLLLPTVFAFGAGWLILRHHFVAPNDLAAMMAEAPTLVRARGIVLTSPLVRDTATGSMALFNYQDPAAYFQLEVTFIADGSQSRDARGVVLVKCDETLPPLAPGDRVETLGWLRRFPEPRNPGEFDRATYARSLGQAGMLGVPERELVEVLEARRATPLDFIRRWRERCRVAATGWLLADLPYTDRTEREALLTALLIGERGPDLAELDQSFRRVGLSHLLAISGAHLGVLAGVILFVLRLFTPPRRWHGLLLVAFVLTYLFLIEARMPVLRAAIMTCAASLGLVFSRRLSAGGLVALSGIILLLWSPQQLFDAGFQLSYGVVLGLIYLSNPARTRWFGPRNQLAGSVSAMAVEWLKTLFAASVVAWAIATPLVIHHFGMVTPMAALASMVAIPLTSLLLAVAFFKMLCGALLPSAGVLLAAPLTVLTDLLISVVQALDGLPGSSFSVPRGTTLWVVLATAAICAWFLQNRRWQRRALTAATAVLAVWLLWPVLPIHARPSLRIDMLSVGDGSCYVIRGGGETILWDCGSSTDLDAGRAQIVPALEALHVHSIDAVIISHSNLDHFSAAIEVAERFDIPRLLITPQFLRFAEANDYSAAAFVLEELALGGARIESLAAGEQLRFGRSTWTVLHPPGEGNFRLANDTSLVIAIESTGRRALLTGDIQQEAMAMLFARPELISADIVELPHHGSHHDMAEEFIASVSPDVVMQSTGWSRWERDRWGESLEAAERLVTARDGACWVEIWGDGAVRVGRFLNH